MSKKKCKPREHCIFGLKHKIEFIPGQGYRCKRCHLTKQLCHA